MDCTLAQQTPQQEVRISSLNPILSSLVNLRRASDTIEALL